MLTLGAGMFVLGFVLADTLPLVMSDGHKNNTASMELGGGVISGGIGGTMMLIGIPLLIAGVKKEKKAKSYLEINNLAVLPKKDGFYAAVGFNF